jgi:stage III sporulation protein AB
MVIKIITSIIIIGCSAMIGNGLANRFVQRTNELRELQGALSRLEAEISHYSTRLPEALKHIGKSVEGETGRLFILTSDKLVSTNNCTVEEAWRQSIEEVKKRMNLTGEEYDILMRFGAQLGCSDKEGQKKFIALTLSQLKLQEAKAFELRCKYERMYKSLGILGGLALVILLI